MYKKRKENVIILKKHKNKENKYKIKTKANNNIYTETANKCDQIFYNNISLQETATTSNKKPKTKTKKSLVFIAIAKRIKTKSRTEIH